MGGAGAGFRASFGTISITISLIDRLSGRLTRLGGNIGQTNRRIASSFRAVGTAGLAATMMVVQQMQSMVESAEPVISSISRLNSVMVQQGDAVQQVTKTTKEWMDIIMPISEATGAALQDISNALWQVASAGVKTVPEMKAVTKTAARLSQQFKVDTREAIDLLVRSIRGFGMSMNDVTSVSGIFNQTISNSTLTMQDLAKTMEYVAPVAGSMGMKIEDISAAIGAMAQAGVVGSKAGTSLRTSITRMAAPTAKAREWMQRLGVSFFEVSEKGRDVRESWTDTREALDDLEKEYREAKERVEELGEAEERYSQRAREVSHAIETVRLKAQKQNRDLTESEMKRIDGLKEKRDILRWQAEDRAIAEAEKREELEENKDTQEKLTSRAKDLWEEYQGLKGEMKPMVQIVSMLNEKIAEHNLTQKEMMTFIKELIGRRGLTGFMAMMSQVGDATEQVNDAAAKQGAVLSKNAGFLGELYNKLKKTANEQVSMTDMTDQGRKMWKAFRREGSMVMKLQHLRNKELAHSVKLMDEQSDAVINAMEEITDMRMAMETLSTKALNAMDAFGGLRNVLLLFGSLATVIPIIYSLSAALITMGGSAAIAGGAIMGLAVIIPLAILLAKKFGYLDDIMSGLSKVGRVLKDVLISVGKNLWNVAKVLFALTPPGFFIVVAKRLGFLDEIASVLSKTLKFLGEIIYDLLVASLKGIWKAANRVFKVFKWLEEVIWGGSLVPAFKALADVVGFFGDLFGKVFDAVKSVITGIIDWLINNWKKVLISILFPPAIIVTLINELFPGLVDDIISALSSLPGRVMDLATQIPIKIWEGIKSMSGWLLDKISGLAGDLVSSLNPMNWDWPGSPPSHVGVKMIEEIGKGIETSKEPVTQVAAKTGESLTQGIVGGMNTNLGGAPRVGGARGGADGGAPVDKSVNIDVQTGDIKNEADEDRLTQKIASSAKRELQKRGEL